MRVGLALEIDSSIQHLSKAVADLDALLARHFLERSYGTGVDNIVIGAILTSPDSSGLHPIRKLRYRKVIKIRIPGHNIEMKNVIEYDIKPLFEEFCHLNVVQFKKYLARKVIESTSVIRASAVKYPGFDLPHFERDLASCLTES